MKFKESKSIYLQIADRINDEILQGFCGCPDVAAVLLFPDL